jgi:hypothetical protein
MGAAWGEASAVQAKPGNREGAYLKTARRRRQDAHGAQHKSVVKTAAQAAYGMMQNGAPGAIFRIKLLMTT